MAMHCGSTGELIRNIMADLVEGNTYGLSSRVTTTSAGKSVIHVKLTDSALKAFDNYQKWKSANKKGPSIQFQGQQGKITIPYSNGTSQFRFSLSALQGDPKGSFDCVKQTRFNSQDELQLVGTMAHRLTVQANDEVYKQTKERMTQAEEDSRKSCAKEIKPGGKYVGRKIKKVIKGGAWPEKNPSAQPSNYSAKPSIKSRPQTNSSNNAASTNAYRTSHINKPSGPTPPPPPPANKHTSSSGSSHGVRMGTSPQQTIDTTRSKPTAPVVHGRTSPNPAVANQPYRLRIMHLLAIRSYKKPELIMRLKRDSDKSEKQSVSQILQQIAVFNQKDNNFSLQKHLLPEIKMDWPGFSDHDRKLLKSKLASLTPGGSHSAASSPSVSPCHSQGSQGSPSQKRPSSTSDDAPPSKKRIAHRANTPTKPEVSTTTPDVVQPAAKQDQTTSLSMEEDHDRENRPKGNVIDSLKSPATSTSETPDYYMTYNRITTLEQRQRFKTDFNSQYEEYRNLHAGVEKVTQRFKRWESDLRQQDEGTKEYTKIRNRILEEYNAVKKDPKYIEQRKRCDYLHKKLAHIKKLIVEYDMEH